MGADRKEELMKGKRETRTNLCLDNVDMEKERNSSFVMRKDENNFYFLLFGYLLFTSHVIIFLCAEKVILLQFPRFGRFEICGLTLQMILFKHAKNWDLLSFLVFSI